MKFHWIPSNQIRGTTKKTKKTKKGGVLRTHKKGPGGSSALAKRVVWRSGNWEHSNGRDAKDAGDPEI
jgi:hypothetical protein